MRVKLQRLIIKIDLDLANLIVHVPIVLYTIIYFMFYAMDFKTGVFLKSSLVAVASFHNRKFYLSHTLNPCCDSLARFYWPHPCWCTSEDKISFLQPKYSTDVADEIWYGEYHVSSGTILFEITINLM